jgi:hypothetical protein
MDTLQQGGAGYACGGSLTQFTGTRVARQRLLAAAHILVASNMAPLNRAGHGVKVCRIRPDRVTWRSSWRWLEYSTEEMAAVLARS